MEDHTFTRRLHRSRSRDDSDFARRSLLSKIDKSEMTQLQVKIRRGNIGHSGPQLPIERGIDDPAKICAYVHYRKDISKSSRPPIFGKDIKVNQEFTENRRVFSQEKIRNKSRTRSRSRSVSRRKRGDYRSPSRERSKSKRPRKSRSRSAGSDRSRKKYSKDRSRYSRDRSVEDYKYSKKRRSLSSVRDDHAHEPTCPMYKDRKERSRERSKDRERYRKSTSPKSGQYRERYRKSTPLRPGEYRPGHPDLALRNRKSREVPPRLRSSPSHPSTSSDHVSPGIYRSARSRSRSPRKDRRSRSPIHYRSSERSRHSRSPPRYESRSRSPKNYNATHGMVKRNHSPTRHNEHEMMSEYGYYPEGWVPPRFPPGAGYPFPRFYPPGFYPRPMIPPGGMIPPGPIMPRIPMFGPYRRPLPVYNNPRPPRALAKSTSNTNVGEKKNAIVVVTSGDSSTAVISEVNTEANENYQEIVENSAGKGEDENGKPGETNM